MLAARFIRVVPKEAQWPALRYGRGFFDGLLSLYARSLTPAIRYR